MIDSDGPSIIKCTNSIFHFFCMDKAAVTILPAMYAMICHDMKHVMTITCHDMTCDYMPSHVISCHYLPYHAITCHSACGHATELLLEERVAC